MRKRQCPLLKRIENKIEINYADLIRGLHFSTDEAVKDRLVDYRNRGLIEYDGRRIRESTVFRAGRRQRGNTNERAGSSIYGVR